MKPPRTGPTQRHQKQRDRNCLLSTGWLPCLPELQAASLATGSSVQEESILLSSMITAVHMISILSPLDKGFLWVARMQTNLEPKLPPITSQVQKTFYSEPYYVCANKFKLKQVPRKELLSRTRPALKSVAYEETFTLAMTMTRKLLKKKMATRLTFLRKLHTKGPGRPLSCLWSITVIPALKLWLHSSPLLWDTPQPWPLSQVHNEGRQCLSICFIHLCLNLSFCSYHQQVGT